MTVLFIDNYDSFSYNLVALLKIIKTEVTILRNDEFDKKDQLSKAKFIIISPGPSTPENAGLSNLAVEYAVANKIPLLGICLGHQVIARNFGCEVIQAAYPMHGKISPVEVLESPLWNNIPEKINVTRYHSLFIKEETLHKDLRITARSSDDNKIMAIEHKKLPLHGIQFHPESITTKYGPQMVGNFIWTYS
jgi:anthranilate synthase/aminodeoxychorismate synthase-like glutamine amidotransferase